VGELAAVDGGKQTNHETAYWVAVRREPRHIDEIAEETGLPVAAISGQMMALELMRMVRNQGAPFYVLL
jgi:predicted Rossmann fold nucleotide-binding protein DprA/Smf involved in DNA uptake